MVHRGMINGGRTGDMPLFAFPSATIRMRAGLAAIALLLIACGGKSGGTAPDPTPRPTLAATYRPTGRAAAGDVFVHLFEWKWTDIASECESVLGPQGFKAVQISPPQEHIVLGAASPWWVRYQPVSYGVDRSRSGTGAELSAMIARCRAAGVDVYVDAVINHMAAAGGTGSNGTVFTKYEYPGLYTRADFHDACIIDDYQSAANVQDCELVGLADLRTDDAGVQQKIAGYLLTLARMGVAGFRIDAAKHMQPVGLDRILARVNEALTAEGRPLPYYFAEVIDHGGEAVHASDYFGLGFSSGGASDITEFKFRGVAEKFLGVGGQRIAQLDPNGPPGSRFTPAAWGLMPADKAVVFLENHDTQRGTGLSYRDGDVFRLANVWMLAQPYGYPSIMSSYAFDRDTQAGDDAGPPSDGAGVTANVRCATRIEAAVIGEWVCEHRDPFITRMVGFRRVVAGTEVTHWWDNDGNAVAFSRGDRGFVAINRESMMVTVTVATGLAAGVYCDLLTGGRAGATCAGTTVTIATGGAVQLNLAPNTAIAIHAGMRL
jgi:alpha-amylase